MPRIVKDFFRGVLGLCCCGIITFLLFKISGSPWFSLLGGTFGTVFIMIIFDKESANAIKEIQEATQEPSPSLWELFSGIFDVNANFHNTDLSKIDTMDGWEFEKYIAKLLEFTGYEDVRVTQGSNDFGVDIVASKDDKKYAIQVKRWDSKINRKAVSDAVGGMRHYNCTDAMVITNNYLNPNALRFAKSSNCKIVDRDTLKEWIKPIQEEYQQGTTCGELKDVASIKASKSIPNDILTQIKSLAEKKFPAEYDNQLDYIESEIKAYRKINSAENIPTDVLAKIKSKAQKIYPDNYDMQLLVIEDEIESYQKIKSLTAHLDTPESESEPDLKPAKEEETKTDIKIRTDNIEKGLSSLQSDEYKEAIIYFTNEINLNNQSAPAYYWRGTAYNEMADKKRAIKDLTIAADLGHAGAKDILKRFQV